MINLDLLFYVDTSSEHDVILPCHILTNEKCREVGATLKGTNPQTLMMFLAYRHDLPYEHEQDKYEISEVREFKTGRVTYEFTYDGHLVEKGWISNLIHDYESYLAERKHAQETRKLDPMLGEILFDQVQRKYKLP